jgi:choline dehydrogenase-like flavoprotein
VGTNLQDRYEVSVIWEMPDKLALLADLKFDLTKTEEDEQLRRWHRTHDGVYANNGVLISIMKKSRPDLLMPDLCIFALPGKFKGYYPGYSKCIAADAKHLTWVILKAHTKDRSGTVRLRCANPRVTPLIDFAYFSEGSDVETDDIKGLVEGIKFVRQITRCRPRGVKEIQPGDGYKTDAELSEFVANEAWGHHASCSCPIGPAEDPMAVLDGEFRVHGTSRLRVVDASVFPQIPGVFIVANIYMLAERATEVIMNAYPRKPPYAPVVTAARRRGAH